MALSRRVAALDDGLPDAHARPSLLVGKLHEEDSVLGNDAMADDADLANRLSVWPKSQSDSTALRQARGTFSMMVSGSR
jgi:homoserine kinase